MRKWSKLIALVLFLVVLAAAYMLLKGGQTGSLTPGAQTSPPSDSNIISFAQKDIVKILIKADEEILLESKNVEVDNPVPQADGTTKIEKINKKIWVNNQFKVDTTVADNMAFAASSLPTKRMISENPEDLSIYGLDNPTIITFYSADGKEESLEIGSSTPTGESYYVRKGGVQTVYTIDSYKAESIKLGKLDLISKNFYNKENLTFENITKLSVYKKGTKFFDSHAVEVPSIWEMTYPLALTADIDDLQRYHQGLISLTASEIVAEKPSDLKLYGLDSPQYTFEYTIDGIDYRLNVGSKNDSLYYGMFDGSDLVFSFEASSIKAVDIPLVDLVDMMIYVPSIYNIEKLVIELDGRVDELEMNITQETEDTDEYFYNGIKIEDEDKQSTFRNYYQAAVALMGDIIDLDAKPQGEAFARLTYTKKDADSEGKTIVLELVPTRDEYGYYIMKNGQYTGLRMGKRQLDKDDMGIRQAYRKADEELIPK